MFERYARRVSGECSTPTASSLFDIVPLLSSAARIPLPGATSSLAVFSSSWVSICEPQPDVVGLGKESFARKVWNLIHAERMLSTNL